MHRNAPSDSRQLSIVGTLAIAVICASANPVSAAYYRRRGSNAAAAARAQRQALINSAKAQLAAAQQVLAAAESTGADAERRLSIATEKLQTSSGELKGAKETARDAEKHLREIEKEILAEQKSTSEYGKAKAELEGAKQLLADIEGRILAKPEVANALVGLTGNELKKAKAKELGSWTEYLVAQSKADAATKKLADLRFKLLQADADYKETAETIREAHRDENKAQDKVASGGSSRLAPLQDRRKAANVAAMARQAIAEAEMVLRSLNAMPANKPTGKNSPGNK
ncbi:MAG: hypothetical protein K8R36_20945 [Planctomycetales bacterium]|nr:hypothetical protein [Planctomycetales bacterium]